MAKLTGKTGRDAGGHWTRTIETAERDAEAAALHANGTSYANLAARYGVSKQAAIGMVRRAHHEAGRQLREQALGVELARLDGLEAALLAVLARHHVTVNNGRVIMLDGEPLEDDGPVVTAAMGLLRVSERRSKLLGLDAPARQTVTVITEDVIDAEIARLSAEVEARADVLAADRAGASGEDPPAR